jgi:hypothetical protein
VEEVTVFRDGEKNLRFVGELLASASSRSHQGPRSQRWQELTLYRTQGGKFVAARVGRTIWQGEVDRYEAVVGDTAAVQEFFGFCDEAKRIYDKAGLDADEVVE